MRSRKREFGEIKIGIKLWSTNVSVLETAADLIKQGVFDYIELTTLPNTKVNLFAKQDVPYIIHIPNEYQGANIGDVRAKSTLKIINFSLDCADKLGGNQVILHAGTSSLEHARSTLSRVNDDRVLLENMPVVGLKNEACLGYDVEKIRYLTSVGNFGLCLDFSHAIKASITLKKNYREIISGFLELKPKAFHICDGSLVNEKDEHLNIGEGKYDFKYFKKCINSNPFKFVTLETPRHNANSLEEDLGNSNILRSIWGISK